MANSIEFDGVDDQYDFTTNLTALTGATSMMIVVRILAADGSWMSFIETESSANAVRPSLGRRNVNDIYYSDGFSSVAATTINSADNWMVVGYSRPAGAAQTVTTHKCVIGGANTHANAGAKNNEAGTVAHWRIGGNEDFANMRVVAAAIWTSAVADASFNGVASAKTSQSILDLSPQWMVESNSGATLLGTDQVGTANVTTVTGTTTSSDGPSGWTYFGATVTVPPRAVVVDTAVAHAANY